MNSKWVLLLALSGAIFAGCDDKKGDDKPALPTKDDVNKAVDKAKDATAGAVDTVTSAMEAAKKNAADWLPRLEDSIKANKLDDAKGIIDKLEAIKTSLPDELKAKFESLKAMFDKAKAGGAALPSLPK